MSSLIVVLTIVLMVVLGILKAKGSLGGSVSFPYLADKPLFTRAERSFLGVLDQAIGKDYRVFGKVRVADVLSVKKGGGRPAFFRISAKHFDFLLCRPDDLRPICAIELNDQSHNAKSRQGRDEFLTEACKAAGLPVIWIQAQRAYTVSDVLALIHEAMPAPGKTAQPTGATSTNTAASGSSDAAHPASADVAESVPRCPKCASPMVRRTAKAGDNQGREFWGCPKFPGCRCMLPI